MNLKAHEILPSIMRNVASMFDVLTPDIEKIFPRIQKHLLTEVQSDSFICSRSSKIMRQCKTRDAEEYLSKAITDCEIGQG